MRRSIYSKKLARLDEIAKKSKLSKKDVVFLDKKVKKGLAERYGNANRKHGRASKKFLNPLRIVFR